MQSDFAKNLALLCSYYNSVSEACRRLQINRSQFNKYLSGKTQPSRHILQKICDFFGVEQHEIYLPHEQFSKLLRVRPVDALKVRDPLYINHIETLRRNNPSAIARYAGYYFEYYYSMSYPESILRALVHINWDGEYAYYERIEKLSKKGSTEKDFGCRYQGMAFYLSDRLFLHDFESLTHNEMSQTILFPSYKSRTTYLTGLRLGVAAESRRLPTCVRVVYEVLSTNIDLKATLKLCGLYEATSESIAPDVKQLISNEIGEQGQHFVAATF